MVDKDTLTMEREAKAERDAEGIVMERADLVLALHEAGIAGWAPGTSNETMKQWLADPASAPQHRLPPVRREDEPRVRRGGETASNQFGQFSVHAASPKQVAYLKRLLAERDLGDIKVPADIDTISKKSASTLIDRLMGRPEKEKAAVDDGPAAPTARRASDKQMAFLRKLIAERDFFSLVPDDRAKIEYVKSGGVPTAKGASALIDELTHTAFADSPQTWSTLPALALGMYRKADGTMYRAYPARQSDRILAKRLVSDGEGGWTFEYAGMASRFVTADEKMSLEEAKAWGANFGTCCVCAALLTDPTSVAAGIGPKCAGKV